MRDLLVCIYMARAHSGYRAFFTHNPDLDGHFLAADASPCSLSLVSPFLPVGIAHYVLNTVFSKDEINAWFALPGKIPRSRLGLRWGAESFETKTARKRKEIMRLLSRLEGFFGRGTLLRGTQSPSDTGRYFANEAIRPEIQTAGSSLKEFALTGLRGKMLFLEELEKSIIENTSAELVLGKKELTDVLQILALDRKIELLPSLGLTAPGQAVCFRCGRKIRLSGGLPGLQASDRSLQSICPVCGFPSLYCEECSAMGAARLCRPLYALGENGPPKYAARTEKIILRGVPPLTPAQTQASADLKEFVNNGRYAEALVWAVCGAGKTEVVIGAMAAVLEQQGRVLYASPRRDVVKELAPRLQKAFREIEMLVSYGGSTGKFMDKPFTAATTHQVMRYYQQFDLVVLDEVDAFPFRGSPVLQHAVQRAVRPGGKIIYLTATPDKQMLARADAGQIKLVTIPARHHGRPVPEPEIKQLLPFRKPANGQWEADPFIVQLLCRWAAEPGTQAFVFLPTVGMVESFGPLLKNILPDLLSYSHAGDKRREEKRTGFKEGKFPLLVSTSIMERGITVKKAHVLILAADYERIFDEAALVQMAGRAGRSAEFPHGEVLFVGCRVTAAMLNARAQIRRLNKIARQLGYLTDD